MINRKNKMKKILFLALCGMALFVTSCGGDDPDPSSPDGGFSGTKISVNVEVSLSNFFSSYNFNDTKHGTSVTEDFRTFHSEFEKFIHVRTLFYNNRGTLVDSLVVYSDNEKNSIQKNIKLPEGTYTVVTTLNFADEERSDMSWWTLCDKQNLSTAYLKPYTRFTKWAIMSYDAKTITVESGNTTTVRMTPSPIGALGYMYLENFYKDQFGNEADNKIRSLALYSQTIADGFRLDPTASDRYMYMGATGSDSWYYLSDKLEPTDFNKSWEYFQSNLYDYFYILAPSFNATFGYVLEGENFFHSYGEASYTITNGQTYLAYWDYLVYGNPYFGLADNNHWNNYDMKSANMEVNNKCMEGPWAKYVER